MDVVRASVADEVTTYARFNFLILNRYEAPFLFFAYQYSALGLNKDALFIVVPDKVPVGTGMQKKGEMGPLGTLVRSEKGEQTMGLCTKKCRVSWGKSLARRV